MKNQFFSLQDLVQMEPYPPLEILSLAPHPEQIEVKHITSIERMTKGFIRRGEFVLTTATSWGSSEKFFNFVKEIYFGGAVAIAFSFVESDRTVPKEVIKFAKDHQFTLILLPWQYRFTDIIAYVLKQIELQHRQVVESWSALQNELLSAYLQHRPLAAAAKIIASHLRADVLITDINNHFLAHSGPSTTNFEQLSEETLASYHLFMPLTQKGYPLANLYLSKHSVSTQDLETFKPFSSNIITPIMLWFDRDDIIKSTRTQLIDDLIWELANGSFKFSEDDYTRARMLGLHLNVSYQCIVGHLCCENGDITNSWLDEHTDDLKRAVIQARWASMVTLRNRYIIAYIGKEEDVEAYMQRFDEAISAYDPHLRCAWGVSGKNKNKGFDKLYQEAKLCADICQAEIGPGHFYSYADTGIFHVLLPALRDRNALFSAKEYLAPLLELEKEKKDELIQILNCYFNTNFNACETARVMYYNRQTLRYKLRKVEELFGISLDRHEQVLYLELCLRLYNLGQSDAFLQL